MKPLRKILQAVKYRTNSHPIGTYSAYCRLECGHHAHMKWSVYTRGGKKKRARCPECDLSDMNWEPRFSIYDSPPFKGMCYTELGKALGWRPGREVTKMSRNFGAALEADKPHLRTIESRAIYLYTEKCISDAIDDLTDYVPGSGKGNHLVAERTTRTCRLFVSALKMSYEKLRRRHEYPLWKGLLEIEDDCTFLRFVSGLLEYMWIDTQATLVKGSGHA